MAVAKAEKAITDVGLTVGTIKPVENSAPIGHGHQAGPQLRARWSTRAGRSTSRSARASPRWPFPNLATLTPMQPRQPAGQTGAAGQDHPEAVVGRAEEHRLRTEPGRRYRRSNRVPRSTIRSAPGLEYTKVPTDLVGKSYDQAVAELKAAKLTAVQQLVDGVQPTNTVLKLGGRNPGDSVPPSRRRSRSRCPTTSSSSCRRCST